MPLDTAKNDGVSDPRNAAMARMFHLVDVGEYTGGGIPNLYRVWKAEGWPEPVFTESVSPARVSLTLYMTSHSRRPASSSGRIVSAPTADRPSHRSPHKRPACAPKALGVSLSRVESLLQQLADEGIVAVEADQGNHLYKLKA